MMNRLRNSDRPAITWFGGIDWRLSALRVIDSTTKIFVKLVIMIRSDGATLSSVMPSRVVTADEGVPSGPLMLTERPSPVEPVVAAVVAGAVGSTGAVGATGAAWPALAVS